MCIACSIRFQIELPSVEHGGAQLIAAAYSETPHQPVGLCPWSLLLAEAAALCPHWNRSPACAAWPVLSRSP